MCVCYTIVTYIRVRKTRMMTRMVTMTMTMTMTVTMTVLGVEGEYEIVNKHKTKNKGHSLACPKKIKVSRLQAAGGKWASGLVG